MIRCGAGLRDRSRRLDCADRLIEDLELSRNAVGQATESLVN
jgi:hypothetical protein